MVSYGYIIPLTRAFDRIGLRGSDYQRTKRTCRLSLLPMVNGEKINVYINAIKFNLEMSTYPLGDGIDNQSCDPRRCGRLGSTAMLFAYRELIILYRTNYSDGLKYCYRSCKR